MTPDYQDWFLSVTANVRLLAKTLAVIADNAGFPEMASRARSVEDDLLDAYNSITWNPYSE